MKFETNQEKPPISTVRMLIHVVGLLVVLVAVGVTAFLRGYDSYNDNVLYAERLSQMQEVTEQLFAGLEDVVKGQWQTAKYQYNHLLYSQPGTTDELLALMAKQAELNEMGSTQTHLIAVDDRGCYYTQYGKQGSLAEMDALLDSPDQVSFVSNSMAADQTQMMFLYRLEQPLTILDDGQPVRLIYYGIARDMEELNPYFNCEAYDGNNSVYVVDAQGSKLFSSSGSHADLLEGQNTFTVLQNMNYLHGSTFDEAQKELQEDGIAYSNAVLDGVEYYYALYQMDNAAWVLLFLVPSSFVATNTVQLVNATTRLMMAFAVFMTLVCTFIIYWVLRRQQSKELQAAERSNAALFAANKKLENANADLEATNHNLERARVATSEALEVAKNASQAKTNFLSNMSHDIRTPMNAIIGITTLMENELDDPEKMREHLAKLKSSGQHLLGIINDILDMNKIESGQASLSMGSINLADQITQIDGLIRAQANQRGQQLTIVTTHLKHENVIGDATRLNQVLVNILSNAIKYTPNGGHILLEVEEIVRNSSHYAKYKFIVQDDGIGMSEEFLAHLYDPFTRAENSVTNKVQGTGLGMSITKSIVELMGGSIHVESALGKGTRFEVVLGFAIDQAADADMQKMSLLLVGCTGKNYDCVRDAVEGKPVSLHAVPKFEDALAALRQSPCDAVLLPWNEPELSEKVRQVRALAQPDTILLAVASDHHDVPDHLAETGLDGFLPLPFFLSNLEDEMERVRAARLTTGADEDVSPLAGLKFLCAEDNELNAEILQALLEMKGASCTIYPNGRELVNAFASIQPEEYDVILMDVMMPVMDGLEAARCIRTSPNPLGRRIPIIAMTANAFTEDIQKSRDAGMDAHLSKPINIDALEQTVRKLRVVSRNK